MRVIQISKAGSGAPNIFIEAGIHAREWISPAMATYLIDSLLNNDEDGFKDSLNFHILIRLHDIAIFSIWTNFYFSWFLHILGVVWSQIIVAMNYTCTSSAFKM